MLRRSIVAVWMLLAATSCVGGRRAVSSASSFQDGSTFFVAWSDTIKTTPIVTQKFGIDARQYRQVAYPPADSALLAFARANPGRLYIAGDEPDQKCVPPSEFARTYNAYVAAIRNVDKTARFSPPGLAEPNDACCPAPITDACRIAHHSIAYMQQFYDAHVAAFGSPPVVDEWRFHDFGAAYPWDMQKWWKRVKTMVDWSEAHGAKMVLGSWGFLDWGQPGEPFNKLVTEAMDSLRTDSRIVQAAWWHWEFRDNRHYLTEKDGSLTSIGQLLVARSNADRATRAPRSRKVRP